METADRYVYNVLDWVATLGGFLRGLKILFGLLLIVPLYNFYETTMIGHLYHAEKDKNKFQHFPTKLTQIKDENFENQENEDMEHLGSKKVNFCK